jgi:hypothetical protein
MREESTSEFDLPKEQDLESKPERYDGSRVLVASMSLVAILTLVPMSMLAPVMLLWSAMVFALTLGVPARQVWAVRIGACFLALFLVLFIF